MLRSPKMAVCVAAADLFADLDSIHCLFAEDILNHGCALNFVWLVRYMFKLCAASNVAYALGLSVCTHWQVRIRCGEYSDATQEVDVGEYGRGKWYEELELEMHYPNDWTQVPDLFVEVEVAGAKKLPQRLQPD